MDVLSPLHARDADKAGSHVTDWPALHLSIRPTRGCLGVPLASFGKRPSMVPTALLAQFATLWLCLCHSRLLPGLMHVHDTHHLGESTAQASEHAIIDGRWLTAYSGLPYPTCVCIVTSGIFGSPAQVMRWPLGPSRGCRLTPLKDSSVSLGSFRLLPLTGLWRLDSSRLCKASF